MPKSDQLDYLRYKERKFGRGCFEQWRAQQDQLKERLAVSLVPFECMLAERPYLLHDQPHFIDFDLWGMLAQVQFTGHHQLPSAHNRLNEWHARLSKLKKTDPSSEKLHS